MVFAPLLSEVEFRTLARLIRKTSPLYPAGRIEEQWGVLPFDYRTIGRLRIDGRICWMPEANDFWAVLASLRRRAKSGAFDGFRKR